MKNIIKVICIIIGLLELVMIIVYFVTFDGGLSSANKDWDTFNGVIMTILTVVNIFVFYQLTVVIEDKNQERAVKEKVFEAQSVITQMRVKQYEEIRTLIYRIVEAISKNKNDEGDMDFLRRKIAELEESFLFKNYELKGTSMLGDESLKIIGFIKKFKTNLNVKDKEEFIKSMITYIKLLEIYIIGQMTTTDNDVATYVKKNIFNIDCTISCVVQVFNNTLEKLKKSKS